MKGFLGALEHLFAMQGQPLWDPWQPQARWDMGCAAAAPQAGWEHRALPNRHPLTSS